VRDYAAEGATADTNFVVFHARKPEA
jgi:hypothetical protein